MATGGSQSQNTAKTLERLIGSFLERWDLSVIQVSSLEGASPLSDIVRAFRNLSQYEIAS